MYIYLFSFVNGFRRLEMTFSLVDNTLYIFLHIYEPVWAITHR